MSDVSPILASSELLTTASAAPAGAALAGAGSGFAGLLAQRLQTVDAQPQMPSASTAAPANTRADGTLPTAAGGPAAAVARGALPASAGEVSPPGGKALPPTALPDADGAAADVLTGLSVEALLSPLGDATLPAGEILRPSGIAELPVPEALTDVATPLSGVSPELLTTDTARGAPPETPLMAVGVGEADLPRAAVETMSAGGVQNLPQDRPLSAQVLQLAQRGGGGSTTARTVDAPAASLGLATSGEPLAVQRAGLPAGTVAPGERVGITEPLPNQALLGESLSRQFQRQIDRMLAVSRGGSADTAGVTASLGTTATDSLTAGLNDGSTNVAWPGVDMRAGPAPLSTSAMTVPVTGNVGQPGWSAELGQRMVWLANQEIREAQIQLNPRHLGPIDVRIVYSDAQQLSVSFNAHNPVAREALDAALPRLRDMFEQQGLNLADAHVFDERASQQSASDHRGSGGSGDMGGEGRAVTLSGADDDPLLATQGLRAVGEGLLDTFA